MILVGDDYSTGGPLDIWCILHDVTNNTFHPAYFEERPMPGPIKSLDEVESVRLKSKMHHTSGFGTLEEAQEGLKEVSDQLRVNEANIADQPIPWDGRIGMVWILPCSTLTTFSWPVSY